MLCIVAIPFLVGTAVHGWTIIKTLHRQQAKLAIQSVTDEIQSFTRSVENSFRMGYFASTLPIGIREDDDMLGVNLLCRQSYQNLYTIQPNPGLTLSISKLQRIGNEVWFCSKVDIADSICYYAFQINRLKIHDGNAIVISWITPPAQQANLSGYVPQQHKFEPRQNTSIDGHDGLFDIIPAFNIINNFGETVGYGYFGVNLSPITELLNMARSQIVISLVIIALLIGLTVFGYINERRQRNLLSSAEGKSGIFGMIDAQELIDSSTDGIRIIDLEHRVVMVNAKFVAVTGVDESEAVRLKCYDNFKSPMCHTSSCPIERINRGEALVKCTECRITQNGNSQRFTFVITPLLNADGVLLGIMEKFKEITSDQALEHVLAQPGNLFEVFMDNLPVGVFIEDDSLGRFSFQNKFLNNITGGAGLFQFVQSTQQAPEIISDVSMEKEIQLVDAANTLHYFRFFRFKFECSGSFCIGGILIDITKRKEAEDRRNVLSKAVENSPVSVVILSPQVEIEYINPSFAELTGYSIEDIYGKNILTLGIEAGSQHHLVNMADEILQGQIWQGNLSIRSKKGILSWVSSSFTPITDDSGRVQRVVAIMENITRTKEYEKELLMAKRHAEDSDRLKTTFLSNLSHEIRTPLNAIIGFASLLSDSDLSLNERNNLSEIIYRNSNELLHLIENIIEISEIESGQITIVKREMSVNSLLEEAYQEIIEEDRKSSGVRLSLRKEKSDNLTIYSDYARLKQVITHLLGNACKFTETGFIEFGCVVKDSNTLLFYVIDSGIGIDAEKQSVIFNPFRQADESSTRRFGGMGLGLAISRFIVEKLGGKIWMESAVDSGTSVFFTIPYIPTSSKFEVPETLNVYNNYQWDNKIILVADDIDANYLFIKSVLNLTNARIIWARNGSEAVDIVKNSPGISLILMDLVMPDMDGFEATRTIKAMNLNIPIIAQTAYPPSGSQAKAEKNNFDALLEKPIRVNKMLKEIDRLMQN